MLKFLREGNNMILLSSQELTNVDCTYLYFKNLKIKVKEVESGWKAKSNVPTSFFQIKMELQANLERTLKIVCLEPNKQQCTAENI